MISEAVANLTVEESRQSETRHAELELLTKLDNMPKAQALSYLTLPGSETSITSDFIEKAGTAPFTRPGIHPIFSRPKVNLDQKFFSLQKWEGVVTEITPDSFFARLVDKSNEAPDEEAEFAIEEISSGDMHLLKIGAVFNWDIGYHESKGGQRTKQSVIRFRRLPAWTNREIEDARKRAVQIRDSLGWGEPEFPTST